MLFMLFMLLMLFMVFLALTVFIVLIRFTFTAAFNAPLPLFLTLPFKRLLVVENEISIC